jgi:uncharacterized damage-inducible protein DinB
MQTIVRSQMAPLPGFRSREAASFLAQLDDQLRLLRERTRGLTPEDLMWQHAPGMNTIGMLLTHLAIVEVYWTKVVIENDKKGDVQGVLGIGEDDDGMPIAEGTPAFPLLNGKDLAFYDDLLDRARNYFKQATKDLPDEDMEREFTRDRPDGSQRVLNVRWFYYHVLEHFSGHFGQILLLMHMRRAGVGERTPR